MMPLLAARVRVVAAVPPRGALDLEPRLDDTGLQVYVGPTQAQRLALADAEGESDGPARGVATALRRFEDQPSFLACEGLDLVVIGRGRR